MPDAARSYPTPAAYLRPKQAAEVVGISLSALYRRLRSADPPPRVKRGKCYLLPRQAFLDWAAQDLIE